VHASSLTQKRFSRHFDTYEQQAVVQKIMAQELVQNTAQFLGNALINVLEIGCGTGLVTKELCKLATIARYCGNDIVPESEEHTRTIVQDGSDADFSFITGNASQITELPFEPKLIISGASFQWINDLPNFIKQLHRLLPANGILAFSSFGTDNYTEIRQLTGMGLNYQTVHELKEMLNGHFEILHASEKLTQLWFDNPTDILRHIRETGVNSLATVNWTRRELASFNSRYVSMFGSNRGLPLSYHPLQIVAKKI